MLVDAHNHIGEKKGVSFSAEQLIKKMDQNSIDKSIVCCFPEQLNNDYIFKSVRKYPDRLVGFATINPWQTTAEQELVRAIEEYDAQGLKLHPVKHGYALDNHSILDPLFEICSKNKLPILVYGGANVLSCPNMAEEMAMTYPDVAILLAHGGQMYETKSAIGVAKRQKNIYIETSAMFAHRINSLLKEEMLSKIVFGTDMPYGDHTLEIEKIKMCVTAPEQQEQIFSGNIRRIFEERGRRL